MYFDRKTVKILYAEQTAFRREEIGRTALLPRSDGTIQIETRRAERRGENESEEYGMLTPAEFVETYAEIGAGKAKAPAQKLFLLAILAGFFIGMGGAVSSTATHALTNVSAAKIAAGLLFPFGLILVILTGSELFTGNCLMTISVLSRKTTLRGMLRNLVIGYLGNFAGSLALAAGCVFSGQLNLSNGGLAVATIKTAAAKCSLTFGHAVLLGVLCNILVCAAVMCAISAKSVPGKAIGAFVPICLFVICCFEHCVANMYYIPAGLFALSVPQYAALAAKAGVATAGLTWGGFLLHNLLPVTLGNLLGGCGYAAIIYAAYGKRK